MIFVPAAKRYRPQKFSEVLDQTVIVRIVQNAIKLNRIPGAMIFTGQRGTGKTTLARLVATAMNCDDLARQKSLANPIEPCLTCFSCINIRGGNDSEVLEIDAASNRGIDDAKELQKIAQQESKKDKWRIVIIDECHGLTKDAQNALLALFENPPRAFLPILCTTEIDKVLPTIVSRCMRFVVKPLSNQAVTESVGRIFSDANQPIETTALEALVRTSQGSLRDIQQVADQLISSAGGDEITNEFLEDVVGIPTLVSYRKVAGALMFAWSDGPAAWYELIEDMANTGTDLYQLFFSVIVNLMRDMRVSVVSRGLEAPVVPYRCGISHGMFEERMTLEHNDLDLLLQAWDHTSRDFSHSNSLTHRANVEMFFLRAWDAKRSGVVAYEQLPFA